MSTVNVTAFGENKNRVTPKRDTTQKIKAAIKAMRFIYTSYKSHTFNKLGRIKAYFVKQILQVCHLLTVVSLPTWVSSNLNISVTCTGFVV